MITYELHNVDGEVEVLDIAGLAQFMALNGFFDSDMILEIARLGVGDTYRDGGGAAPEWSLRRVS